MKRIQRRGAAVLALCLAAAVLTGIFLYLYVLRGRDWVAFPSNGDAYDAGRLRAGRITDRNGEELYAVENGVGSYRGDGDARTALLHTLGDREGKIGTGAIYKYADRILGYDVINGLYDPEGTGGTAVLAADAEALKEAHRLLDGHAGAVAVINYKTGEVLCAASSPSYDPDDPPEIGEDDTSGVYMNRALSAAYTPGSVFKLVTLSAALETLDDVLDRDFHCSGKLDVGGGSVTCTSAHGDMKLEDALARSCNCVFASLALELGGERLREQAERLGLLTRLEVDGILTARGSFDAAPEGSLNLGWSGAGQYNDLVTPIAMARLCAAIANGGMAPELTGLRSDEPAKTARIMEEDTAERIGEMMDYAVHLTYGEENFPGLALRAKSGTAEVGSGKPNAWFVGYLADEEHPYAFAVCVEKGGSGAGTAGPVANGVLQVLIKDRGK